MKKFRVALLALLLCATLAGCDAFRLSSIDDLISPISPSGEDAEIKAALDSYCKGGYSIKIPTSGGYVTSFIKCDLGGDSNDKAIAFYEPSDKLGIANMAVLSKSSSKWQVVSNTEGIGADVNFVDFADLNNDGSNEVIVGWSVLSNSSTSNLCVYSFNTSFESELIGSSIPADKSVCVDINDDSLSELLVFCCGGTASSPKAQLYSFKDSQQRRIGETKLDSSIIDIYSVTCARSDEGMSVYADAVRSGGDSLVTEILYWSNYYDSVISPFYSYSTGKTKETSRNNTIVCRDIDNDNEIEIPLDKSVSGLPAQLSAQKWVSFNNTVLNHNVYSIACKKDGYLITLSDDNFSKMKLSYDEEKRELTFNDGKNDVFSVLTVIRSDYSSDSYSDYSQIFSDSGFVYLAKTYDNKDTIVTIDDLKNSIKPY